MRPAGAQPDDPTLGSIAVVRSGDGGTRRVPLSATDRLVGTVEIAISERVEAVWLCDREWFLDRLGDDLPALEGSLATVAGGKGVDFRGWTAADLPSRTEVYGAVEGSPPSPDPALDRPGE